MNHCVPDWNFEDGLPVTNQNQKKSMGPGHELVELLWQNGQVVLNSQTHRKLNDHPQPRQAPRNGSIGNSSNLIQDDETVSWIDNPFEDCFEKEFCSSLFNDLPSLDHAQEDKVPVKQFNGDDDKFVKFSTPNPTHVVAPLQQQQNPMPPPRFQLPGSAQRSSNLAGFGNVASFAKVPIAMEGDLGGSGAVKQGKGREFPTVTVGSSHCGSNQVQNDPDWSRVSSSGVGTTAGLSSRPFKDNILQKGMDQSEGRQTETVEPTLTSSSGGSGSSFARTCRKSTGFSAEHKRKKTDVEESASQSEAAELESAAGNKSSRQSGSAKRSRAAEVHNLSERRRRDRINEKMKALQELIPHCSKSDKASMLDEAIEYLKSLQLQLQIMWMGGGMGPMMFPGIQRYMSQMSMGMGSPSLTSIPNAMLSRVPLMDQSMSMAQTPNQTVMCQTPAMSHVIYPNQMQNPSFPEQYARYMGFQQMQTTPQPMNMSMFRFGPQAMQQSHPMAPPVSSIGPFSSGATTNDALSGKTS